MDNLTEYSISLNNIFNFIQQYWVVFSIVFMFIVIITIKNKIKQSLFEALMTYPINASLMAITLWIMNWYKPSNNFKSKELAVLMVTCFILSPLGVFVSAIFFIATVSIIGIDVLSDLILPLL